MSSSSGACSCSWDLGYLPVSAFAEDPQQLEALGPDGLRPLVDVVLRYLDLLTVVHVAAPTFVSFSITITKSNTRVHGNTRHTYNSKPLH